MKDRLLFTLDTPYVTVNEVAKQLNVSVASINNWIKEGLLHTEYNGYILQNSLFEFQKQIIGKQKLVSRANKQKKDSNDFQKITQYIQSVLENNDTQSEKLPTLYENLLSESYKNIEGIYYTPEWIIDDMLQSIEGDITDKTFLEPCCGTGNFIIQAIKKGIKPENVYGYDTDMNAVAITKKRIYDLTGYESNNIICGDFLQLYKQNNQKFDYIFTNPPWGKKINKRIKDEYAKRFHLAKSSDTCALFLYLSLSLLKKDGKLGFLLPEAFFNVATFETIRTYVLQYHITRIVDYGKFGNLLTKACAIVLNNDSDISTLICEIQSIKYTRKQSEFKNTFQHIYNYSTSPIESAILQHLFSLPYITLQTYATWFLGIVTGNNDKICKSYKAEGYVPIYRGKDITPQGFCTPSLFIEEKQIPHCRQVAPLNLYMAHEKIVYRFISNKIICFCDTNQRYILNSANAFILKDTFPITAQQLTDLLNSDCTTWIFQHIFNTHKILRTNLEQIPIFVDYFQQYAVFNEEAYLNYLQLEKKDGTYRIKR